MWLSLTRCLFFFGFWLPYLVWKGPSTLCSSDIRKHVPYEKMRVGPLHHLCDCPTVSYLHGSPQNWQLLDFFQPFSCRVPKPADVSSSVTQVQPVCCGPPKTLDFWLLPHPHSVTLSKVVTTCRVPCPHQEDRDDKYFQKGLDEIILSYRKFSQQLIQHVLTGDLLEHWSRSPGYIWKPMENGGPFSLAAAASILVGETHRNTTN
jgi:hypothetical protein